MTSAKIVGPAIVFCGILAIASSVSVYEVKENLKKKGATTLDIPEYGDFYYFTDPNLRNQQAAEALCNSTDPTSNLAVIGGSKVFNSLRLGSFLTPGTYWINGKEVLKNSDPTERFKAAAYGCTEVLAKFDLKGVDVRSGSTATEMCLVFVKATTVAATYIQSVPCTGSYRVLCSIPVDIECKAPGDGGQG